MVEGEIPTGAPEGEVAKATPAAGKAEGGQVGAHQRSSGEAEVNLDKLASDMYPPKTIPQFKRTEIDPLNGIVTEKPAGVDEDEAKEVKWRDGDPIVDRKGSTERDERPDGEPSKQISDIDKSIDMAKSARVRRAEESNVRAQIRELKGNGELSTEDEESLTRSAEKHKREADRIEDWMEVLVDNPVLEEEGWSIYRITAAEVDAEKARQDADFIKATSDELLDDFRRGRTNLGSVMEHLVRGALFGGSVDQALSMKLKALLSGDRNRTIGSVEADFLAEVARASSSYERVAVEGKAMMVSLAKGQIPKE